MEIPRDKKKELLGKLFWDRQVGVDYILDLLEGGSEKFTGDRITVYCKLLMTYDWYTLLKLIPLDRLIKEALSDRVIECLYPAELKKKYKYAQKMLSRHDLSFTG